MNRVDYIDGETIIEAQNLNDIQDELEKHETQISRMAEGSPKGVYDTLAALQAAYPQGAAGIYIVKANGEWYYWSGSAWTSGGKYLPDIRIVQEMGEATDAVMSQNVVSTAITNTRKNVMALVKSYRTSLSGDVDYNDIKTSGNYQVVSASALTDGAANYPSKSAHTMVVFECPTANTQVFQIAFLPYGKANVVVRSFTSSSGSWSNWRTLASRDEIPTEEDITNIVTNYIVDSLYDDSTKAPSRQAVLNEFRNVYKIAGANDWTWTYGKGYNDSGARATNSKAASTDKIPLKDSDRRVLVCSAPLLGRDGHHLLAYCVQYDATDTIIGARNWFTNSEGWKCSVFEFAPEATSFAVGCAYANADSPEDNFNPTDLAFYDVYLAGSGGSGGKEEIEELKAAVEDHESRITTNEKNIQFLIDVAKGVLYKDETVEGFGKTIHVPEQSLSSSAVDAIGGRTLFGNIWHNSAFNTTYWTAQSDGSYAFNATSTGNWSLNRNDTTANSMIQVNNNHWYYISGMNHGGTTGGWGISTATRTRLSVTDEGVDDAIFMIYENESAIVDNSIKLMVDTTDRIGQRIKCRPLILDITRLFGYNNPQEDKPDIEEVRAKIAACGLNVWEDGTTGGKSHKIAVDVIGNYFLPSDILLLPDYGVGTLDHYNWIDFENGIYHHNYTLVENLSTMPSGQFVNSSYKIGSKTYYYMKWQAPNAKPNGYIDCGFLAEWWPTKDKSFTYHIGDDGWIYFLTNRTFSEWKNRYPKATFIYEINEELIPISTQLPLFNVEAGGDIVLHQAGDYSGDVYNKATFIVKAGGNAI